MSVYNNDNELTNGELFFIEKIKNNIEVVFDVGCRTDSLFLNINKIVHYFDPVTHFIDELKTKENKNKLSFFNSFGFSDINEMRPYYHLSQSFVNRRGGNSNQFLELRTGYEYVQSNIIPEIDFLKIDVEGYELKVLKGFGDFLDNIKIIQFEYGGTYRDAGIRLKDVIDLLMKYQFQNFYYLSPNGLVLLKNFDDHYQYCNIITTNDKFLIPDSEFFFK